jgi:hypothetical protein
MVETIRAGDALLITDTGEFPEIAREHGARIVGITSPRFIDEYNRSLHSSFTEKRHMGDTAEMLLHSHLPFPDGMVKCPEYPFPILPGSGIIRLLLVTALAGETYRRSGGIGLTGNLPPEDALGFISTVIDRAGKITDQIDGIRKAGSMAAEKIMQRGSLCIYDSREALKNEIPEVYGGPLFARYITRQEIMDGRLKSRDVLLFGSLRSNAPGDLDLVRTARSFTDAVISLCPHDETGGYRLFKESAFGLDNLSIERGGVRSFNDGQKTLLHTGGIMNCILMWMLIGETIDSLASQGKPPAYLMGSYVTGSEEYNAKARTLAEKRGF